MGRMNDALRKAAEERERKRRQKGDRGSDTDSVAAPVAPVDVASDEPTAATEVPRPEAPTPPVASDEAVATPALPERPKADAGPAPTEERPGKKQSRAERARAKARAHEERASEATSTMVPDAPAALVEPAPLRHRDQVDPRVVCFHSPRDARAEQMRGVRTSLLTMDIAPKSVAVTSGSPDEGKSLACCNLAASLVEGGSRRVLLVDANLRHPELHEIVGVRPGSGLSDLMGGAATDPASLVQETRIPGVDILCAGESLENPGSLLNPKALAGVLGLLEGDYDFVVVDTPALDEYADAAVMAPEVDGAILVCAVEGPPRAAAEKALDLLESARTRILGILATNCG